MLKKIMLPSPNRSKSPLTSFQAKPRVASTSAVRKDTLAAGIG